MFAPKEIDKRRFIDILFEGRNKQYGAYMLRRNYYRNVFAGLIISVSAMVLGLLFPFIIDLLRPEPDFTEQQQIVDVNLLPPPPGALELEYARPVSLTPPENAVPKVTKDTVIEEKKPVKKEKPKDNNTQTTDTSSTGTAGGGEPGGTGNSNELNMVVDEVPKPSYNWQEYLTKNLRYPDIDKRMNVQGKVIVSVIMNDDGTVREASISKSVSKTIDAEALRIIKTMPAWQPAIRNGHPVPLIVKIGINFTFRR